MEMAVVVVEVKSNNELKNFLQTLIVERNYTNVFFKAC